MVKVFARMAFEKITFDDIQTKAKVLTQMAFEKITFDDIQTKAKVLTQMAFEKITFGVNKLIIFIMSWIIIKSKLYELKR